MNRRRTNGYIIVLIHPTHTMNQLIHSMGWMDENNNVTIGSSPVHLDTQTDEVESIPLKARVY